MSQKWGKRRKDNQAYKKGPSGSVPVSGGSYEIVSPPTDNTKRIKVKCISCGKEHYADSEIAWEHATRYIRGQGDKQVFAYNKLYVEERKPYEKELKSINKKYKTLLKEKHYSDWSDQGLSPEQKEERQKILNMWETEKQEQEKNFDKHMAPQLSELNKNQQKLWDKYRPLLDYMENSNTKARDSRKKSEVEMNE